jgi:ATP-binding cassette subfamily E protein 1
MNKFLKLMNISFRRDNETYRPRINKLGSVKDVEQKEKGLYFYYENIDK